MKSKKAKQIEQTILHPRENPNLFGHDDAIATVFAAYKNGNMPGSWLISGPRGIGKATLAYRLARFILYYGSKNSHSQFSGESGLFSEETLTPLTRKNDTYASFSRAQSISHGEMELLTIPTNGPSFAKVSIGSHPDLLVLEAGLEDAKSASGDILVDDARKIGSFLHLTASETPYRIVIIDSIDDMNTNAANSILKLLEEPPANAIFILVSHAPGKLLPTIRSRCRNIKMRSLADGDALKVMQTIAPEISEDIASSLNLLAGGSPGVAYDLHVNKGIEIYEKIIGILSGLPKLDVMAIQKLGESVSGKANENSWRIAKMLINKIIMDLARNTAINETTREHADKKINKKFKLSVAIGAEKLVELWQEVNEIFAEADSLHLDRKAILLKVFKALI